MTKELAKSWRSQLEEFELLRLRYTHVAADVVCVVEIIAFDLGKSTGTLEVRGNCMVGDARRRTRSVLIEDGQFLIAAKGYRIL